MRIVYKHQGRVYIGNYSKVDMGYYHVYNHKSKLRTSSGESMVQVHSKNVLGTYKEMATNDEIHKEHAEYFV